DGSGKRIMQWGFDQTILRGSKQLVGETKCIRIRAGWPMKTLEGASWERLRLSSASKWTENLIVIKSSANPASDLWLPTRPLLWETAVDAIAYGALFAALYAIARLVRRRIRVRRGRCPACAYPVGTSPVCTECGNEHERVKR